MERRTLYFLPRPVRFLVAIALLAVLFLPVAAQAGLFSDTDPNWREGDYVLPAPPTESSLRQFFVSVASPNRFLIDESTLSVGEDGVVRYVLVVRTSGGAENVTFEGIRCTSGERRIYAMGRPDGEWVAARRSDWEPISNNAYNRPRAALAFDHFCDGPVPPRSRDQALRQLRDGVRSMR